MNKRLLKLSFVLVATILLLNGQAQTISIKKASGQIKLDAILDEPDWQSADKANNFQQYFPKDGVEANSQTEIRLTYDEHFIYVGAKMYNLSNDRKYVTPSLRRDFRGEANDGITLVFDTFKDRTNGFVFGLNPFGVQREGLISNGGQDGSDFSLNWDNRWFSEVKIFEGYWIAELAIPFKSIRFKEGLDSWFVNFYRIDSEKAERSTWAPIPRNYGISTLGFGQELLWDKALEHPGPNVSIIPYIGARSTKDYVADSPTDKELAIGGDAKIAVGPALNLDLTINPDFSQVEVDQQVTNLDRFEIFFPERRQFFLENADLFASFGLGDATPFFSRRIGVAQDTSTGQNIQNQIYAGARLSGKINNNVRIGLLSMQAGRDRDLGLPSTNYTVAAMQHKVFTRSNVGIIFVNKQAFQDSIGGDFVNKPQNFNRMLGIDYNLLSKNNAWAGKFFYHRSFEDNQSDSAFAAGASLTYNTLRWNVEFLARSIGANYNPEVGFIRRRDVRQVASTVFYNMYPKHGPIQNHGPGIDFDILGNDVYGLLDWDANLLYQWKFNNTAFLGLRFRHQYTYLFNSFDASGTDGQELPAGSEYYNWVFRGELFANQRKKLSGSLQWRVGDYFNGTTLGLYGSLSYRYQPWGTTSINFSYDRIRLPQPYNDAQLILIGPRIDLTFSKKLFWTTFVQYNSQIENLNINSRLQWRFAPVSDIFLVYTDNYFTSPFSDTESLRTFRAWQPKQRAIVFKITYWLNI